MMKKISQLRLMKIAFELNSPEIIAKKEKEKADRKADAERKYMDILDEKMFNDHEAIKKYIMSLPLSNNEFICCNYNKKERSFYNIFLFSTNYEGYKYYVTVYDGKYHCEPQNDFQGKSYKTRLDNNVIIPIGEDK